MGGGHPKIGTSHGAQDFTNGTSLMGDGFVWESEQWKHRFGQEEQDLFMPDVPYEEFVEAQQ